MPALPRATDVTLPQQRGAATRTEALLAAGLVALWLLFIILGFLRLRSTAVMVGGNEMSQPRALFTSVNAATLTGFQQSVAVDQMLITGQITLFLLMVGGIYLTTTAAALAVVRVVGLPYSTARVFGATFVVQGLGMLLGGLFLASPPQRDFFNGMFQATSALGNCGLSLGDAGTATDRSTLLVLMPLAFLGGLGVPVLMELFDIFTFQRTGLSVHSRVVLGGSAAVFLIGLLGC